MCGAICPIDPTVVCNRCSGVPGALNHDWVEAGVNLFLWYDADPNKILVWEEDVTWKFSRVLSNSTWTTYTKDPVTGKWTGNNHGKEYCHHPANPLNVKVVPAPSKTPERVELKFVVEETPRATYSEIHEDDLIPDEWEGQRGRGRLPTREELDAAFWAKLGVDRGRI